MLNIVGRATASSGDAIGRAGYDLKGGWYINPSGSGIQISTDSLIS